MSKIVIDAGHGGADPGAVFDNRREKDDTMRLSMAVGEILEKEGYDIVYTRTEDIYDTPFQKAQKANASGADFFVSLHRNSSEEDGQYEGVETLVFDDSGTKAEMARNINANLEKLGFRNIGVKERPGLVVLKRTQMPALLVEVGFINTEKDNRLFDEKFSQIAQAIADGISQTIRQDTAQTAQEAPPVYHVQTGYFKNPEYAREMEYQLSMQGFSAWVEPEAEIGYRVLVGSFGKLENAVKMERALRKAGYSTFIRQ